MANKTIPILPNRTTPTLNLGGYRPIPNLKKSGALVLNAKRRTNPLRFDPTRTGLIRRSFRADIHRRFRKLKVALRDFMVDKDALGLAPRKLGQVLNVQPREYQFRTASGKVKAFREWLVQQMEAGLLSVPAGQDPSKPWTSPYIESAYRRGMENAYGSVPRGKKEQVFGGQTREEFMKTAFNLPETTSKIELLATRAFEGMRGITASIGSELNRVLAQGIADGKGPLAIAREMSDRIDAIESKRAFVIARTETIHAHAEGQIDSFERLGVEKLNVEMEFSTAGDDLVCPICAALEGKTYTTEEARGVIPVHPNCRCTWIPALPKRK